MAGLRQILCGSRSGAADDRPCDDEPPALPFPTVADVRQRDHSSPGPAAATVPIGSKMPRQVISNGPPMISILPSTSWTTKLVPQADGTGFDG